MGNQILQEKEIEKFSLAQQIEIKEKIKYKFRFIGVFLLIVIFSSFSVLSFVKYAKNSQKNKSQTIKSIISTSEQKIGENSMEFPEDISIGKNVLISEIPNFENLTINDLPNFSDYRYSFRYRNRLIIVGFGRIVDYDLENNKILRINNDVLSCSYGAVAIGNYLYVSCNGGSTGILPYTFKFLPSILYKVDIESGKIVKNYFGSREKRDNFVNLNLVNKDNILWGSTNGYVIKIDSLTDQIVYYNHKQLGFPENGPHSKTDCICGSIYTENDKVTVPSNYDCGSSLYNENSDSWVYSGDINKASSPATNEDLKKIKNFFPYYFAISENLNGKYYLFSNNEIDTLTKGEFPKFFVKTNLSKGYYSQTNTIAYVDSSEKYAILLDVKAPSPEALPSLLTAELVDLENGSVIDLMGSEINRKYLKREWKILDEISYSSNRDISENNQEVFLGNILTINLKTKTLTFKQPIR